MQHDNELLKLHIKQSDMQFNLLRQDLAQLQKQIHALNIFKWKVSGMLTLVIFVVEGFRIWIGR